MHTNNETTRDLLKRLSYKDDTINETTRDLLLHKRLAHLKEFNKKQRNKLSFFVIDRDPCTGKETRYFLRKRAPKIADVLENQGFQTVFDKQYAGKIAYQAPWKRLMYDYCTS